MGAYSTLRVSRSKVMELFLAEMYGTDLDSKLENFMDGYLRDRLYNAIIVDDDEGNDDGQV